MCNATYPQWMFVYFYTSTSPPPSSSFDEESQHAPLTEVLTCHCQATTTARSSFTNRPFPALLQLHPRQHPRQQQHHHHLRAEDQVAENSFNIINVAPPPPRTGSNYTGSNGMAV